MSLLKGGFRFTPKTLDEFLEEFVKTITPQEWAVLALLPNLERWTELVAVVCEIRSAPQWSLPPEHPLNPASRYAEATA